MAALIRSIEFLTRFLRMLQNLFSTLNDRHIINSRMYIAILDVKSTSYQTGMFSEAKCFKQQEHISVTVSINSFYNFLRVVCGQFKISYGAGMEWFLFLFYLNSEQQYELRLASAMRLQRGHRGRVGREP